MSDLMNGFIVDHQPTTVFIDSDRITLGDKHYHLPESNKFPVILLTLSLKGNVILD